MYLFRLGRLSGRIRNLDILEVVLPNCADGIPVNSSNERKEPKAGQSILEEIWPSRSNKSRALSQFPIVVGGMGNPLNFYPMRYLGMKLQRFYTGCKFNPIFPLRHQDAYYARHLTVAILPP